MNWLLQNWIWVALGTGLAYFLLRGSLGGHGAGHGGLIGMRHGGHAGGGGHGDQPDSPPAANPPEAAVDPVGGEAVRTTQALTSLYRGKIYYFASKENRDRFEAAPQEYAQKAAGHPAPSAPEARSTQSISIRISTPMCATAPGSKATRTSRSFSPAPMTRYCLSRA